MYEIIRCEILIKNSLISYNLTENHLVKRINVRTMIIMICVLEVYLRQAKGNIGEVREYNLVIFVECSILYNLRKTVISRRISCNCRVMKFATLTS